MSNDIESALKIGENDLRRRETERFSKYQLQRIKDASDENLSIINKMNRSDDESARSIIINLIAAIDYYIHEIILWGIIAITQDKFKKGKKYDDFMISIKFVKDALEADDMSVIINKEMLKKEIVDLLCKETYQKWNSITNGLDYILPIDVRTRIGVLVNGNDTTPAKFQASDLNELGKIRDNLVHNFGRNYVNGSNRESIGRDINNDIKLVEYIIDCIHEIISNYESEENDRVMAECGENSDS